MKAVLMKTASKTFPSSSVATDPNTGATYTSNYDIFTVGAGYVDVWAALSATDVAAAGSTALSPTASYSSATGQVLINNTSALDIWGSNVVWGDRAVFGSNLPFALQSHFGQGVMPKPIHCNMGLRKTAE